MTNHDHNDFLAELKKELSKRNASTIDDANAIVAEISNRRNAAASADFRGLSPMEMHRFLYLPYDSPQFVEFATRLSCPTPDCRIMKLFALLAAKIGDKGVKATATGNLLRGLVREIAVESMPEEEYRAFVRYGEIRTELEFRELHITRIVGETAGLIRRVKGSFILSKKCQKLLAEGFQNIHPILLRTYATKIDWQYVYPGGSAPLIQQAHAFTLYLLARFGEDWRPPTFYEDAFLQAFPMVFEQIPERTYTTKEAQLRRAFSSCNFLRFGKFFGLVEIHEEVRDHISYIISVRKTSLLDEIVRFHIPQ